MYAYMYIYIYIFIVVYVNVCTLSIGIEHIHNVCIHRTIMCKRYMTVYILCSTAYLDSMYIVPPSLSLSLYIYIYMYYNDSMYIHTMYTYHNDIYDCNNIYIYIVRNTTEVYKSLIPTCSRRQIFCDCLYRLLRNTDDNGQRIGHDGL